MPSVSITTARLTLFICLLGFVSASAQENSPYSRYGIGDLYPSQNIVNRSMGGMTAAFTDPSGQFINFNNPASYGDFKRVPGVGGVVVYDIGLSIDARTLRSKIPVSKYSSANFIPAYISLGVPLGKGLGAALGLRPYSRINYSIFENSSVPGVDTARYLYEGSGGLNQAFIGLGKKWGGFSLGFNTGYMFGKKENNTRLSIFNSDTAYDPYYLRSNSTATTSFGKVFLSLGAMYDINLRSLPQQTGQPKKDLWLRLGATTMLGQTFNASQDLLRETFEYDASGGTTSIDSVYKSTGTAVKIETPATFTIGAMFHKTATFSAANNASNVIDMMSVGVEYETSKWSSYRINGQADRLNDWWQLRIGGHILPSATSPALLGRSTYRFGLNYGRDYINADGNGLKTFSGSIGIGIPAKPRDLRNFQYTTINLGLEFGKRGSRVNNVTESFFRVSAGFSLTDLWFIKRKYD